MTQAAPTGHDATAADGAGTVLALRDVCVAYGRVQAVRSVSLDVPAGRALCVVGPNGAGKTSLVRAVAGLERVSGGEVRWRGEPLGRQSVTKRIAAGIVYVPEGTQVFGGMTVEENLAVPLIATRRPIASDTFAKVYAAFPILERRATQDAGTLSGGENRMLAVARALVLEPGLLIVDEPSLGLSPQATATLAAALRALAEGGQTVLVSEQNLACATAVGGDACLMVRGEIRWRGPNADLAGVEPVRAAVLGQGLS
ncbi:ABC transporter ATP-binding protein [Conexibacter sp. CPCC 206217]|uniref:ABC transporter ATP-binding protein n=1 Tax=Conexibacter sp. CPCC 206217 TaxID=3064574 RepID=UPI00271B7BF9|nr:ATP-binding cassette domain-containing protein [Conexibacter sp. CPCC 206217]MDO8210122.1 ATP-binding cassette domain-containing protein [Conexibacter sp. CPCC 206217]